MDGLMKMSGLKVDYLCFFFGCQVIFVSFNQFFSGVCVMESLKSGNTLPRLSGEQPICSKASLQIGLCTMSFVFCIRVVTYITSSLPYGCISSQVSFLMSLFLNAVRQENRKTRFNAGAQHNIVLRKMLLVSRDCLNTLKETIRGILYFSVTEGGMDIGTERYLSVFSFAHRQFKQV